MLPQQKKNKKENPIPKDTESIIKQAEAAMAEQKKRLKAHQPVQKKEQSTIQVTNGKDTDPLETKDWLESLSQLFQKMEIKELTF